MTLEIWWSVEGAFIGGLLVANCHLHLYPFLRMKFCLIIGDEPAYSVQPHFHFSITFYSSQIHCHVMHLYNILHDTHKPPWLLACTTCPHWSHYQLHHWTSLAYGMYMWPMDPTAIFPFLDRSLHCFLRIFPLFYFANPMQWYTTALVSYLTCPDMGWPVSSHCTTWSVSQQIIAILLQMILVLISFIVIFVFNHL